MRVAAAMSGGVDSTASALILKEEGHDVVGVHMHLYPHGDAAWQAAQRAAEELGIPLSRVDLSREFEERVVRFFVQEYARGRTPSPCPICNRFIKTTLLYGHAQSLGCEALATGHYARIGGSPEHPLLLKGLDKAKDQSYFLSMIRRDSLSRTLFPLGQWTKTRVRNLLSERGILIAQSGESQELCFVPDGNYRTFLRTYGLEDRPGYIVNSSGKILGKHKGISGYTVGQRRGLGIPAARPLYVIGIKPESNTVVVGDKEETFVSEFTATDFNLLADKRPGVGEQYHVKVRSTSPPVPCRVVSVKGGTLTAGFDKPQAGVAPGQAAVLYSGDVVVGGGWIS